jgi:two-component system CheB/CheR fusion protein
MVALTNVVVTGARRVLVVDDDPDIAEIVCLVLAGYGHRCHTAACGQRALELATAVHPDVVLVDINLPDMSGYDFACALRADQRFDAIYLVAVSGLCGPEHRARARDAGFDELLVKPVEGRELERVVGRERTERQRGQARAG